MSGAKRLKVLFFAPVPDFKGGAERSLFDLMSNPAVLPMLAIPARGPLTKRAQELGIPYEEIAFRSVVQVRRPFRVTDGFRVIGSLLGAAQQLKTVCRRHSVSLVHSNGMKAHVIAVTARMLGGRPVVTHIRDIANTRVERLTWRAIQIVSDRMILVSRACWPWTALPSNTHVVHNGVRPPPASERDVAAETMVVGFIGRIHPHKGLHVLLDALALAIADGARVELRVRGSFAEEAPGYREEIDAKIVSLGLGERVKFEGFLNSVDEVYARLQVVCVPSVLPDPLPRSVMEAMAFRLPVVASPVGGIPEMIEDGRNGYIALEPQAIARRLLELYRDPELRKKIGDEALQTIKQEFSIEGLHDRLRRVYESISPA
jgi:glycosyltransferase involved in cell wall biosynthesis